MTDTLAGKLTPSLEEQLRAPRQAETMCFGCAPAAGEACVIEILALSARAVGV